ncbi:unnamed protein product [Pleuronectes platessa]|uniref:Uncharacterized protein n=1 Tax=Pleuronectes platessa TaxID=8262 RepID=A0A9N7YV69_PLEPL|nr:unnamed protein product [Pleuronectes platessa]
MCLTGSSSDTHAAQILQLTRGPEDEAGPLGSPNHPFSDTHLSHPDPPLSSLPVDDPRNQQGSAAQKGASCTPALGPEPRSVNQRLFIAGTVPCQGSQPSLAPSVPGP